VGTVIPKSPSSISKNTQQENALGAGPGGSPRAALPNDASNADNRQPAFNAVVRQSNVESAKIAPFDARDMMEPFAAQEGAKVREGGRDNYLAMLRRLVA
jgi:hypothetical protein